MERWSLYCSSVLLCVLPLLIIPGDTDGCMHALGGGRSVWQCTRVEHDKQSSGIQDGGGMMGVKRKPRGQGGPAFGMEVEQLIGEVQNEGDRQTGYENPPSLSAQASNDHGCGDSLQYFTRLVSIVLHRLRGGNDESVGTAGAAREAEKSRVTDHASWAQGRERVQGGERCARGGGKWRDSAQEQGHFITALAQAWQDGRRRSACTDESGECICRSDGTVQAEGQGDIESGLPVVWRAHTGHEAEAE
ncbi:hypothetical protein C8R44DRAFT_755197 [Mycena epipterygia]|nr:hypothetical protein C8R44DRAFT_755197 [Mycena epipterygia]